MWAWLAGNLCAMGVANCRYPLLLDRLLKLTPDDHVDRDDIILARRYVEETLSVINAVRRTSLIQDQHIIHLLK